MVPITVIGEAYIDVKGKTDNFASSVEQETHNNVLDLAKKAALWFGGAFVVTKGISLFKDVIAEAEEATKTTAQTEAVIKSTGGAAGVTADHIGNLATKLSNLSGVDDEVIQGGENLLLTFTNVRNGVGKNNDIFDQATTIMQDMSVALGQDMKSSAIQLGKALNDPIKGVTALQRVGVSFTADQKEQIKTLVESGRTMDAQKLILAELGKEFGGSAAAQATASAKLKTTFKNMEEELGLKLLPVFDKVLGYIAEQLPKAMEFLEKVGSKLSLGIKAMVAAFKEGDVTSDGFVGQMERVGIFLRKVWDALQPVVSFMEDHWKPVLIAVGALLMAIFPTALFAGLALLYVKFEGFRDVVNAVAEAIGKFISGAGRALGDLVEYLQEHWAQFSEAFGHIMVVIRDVVTPILLAIRAVWNAVSDDIFNYVERVWNMIAGVVKAVMEQIRAVIQIVTALINGDWGKVWDGIKDLFKGIWDEMYAIVAGVLGMFRSVVGAFFSVFSDLWNNGWDAVINLLASVWDRIYGLFKAGFDWIVDHWKLLLGVLVTVLTGGLDLLVAFIVAHIDDIVDFFKKLPGRVLDALGDVASWLVDTGKRVIGGFVAGLVAVEQDIWDFWIKLPARILAFFLAVDMWLFDTGLKLLHGFIDGMLAAWEDVSGFFRSLIFSIPRWLGDLSRLIWDEGTALVRGFINGMMQLWEDVGGFFRSLVYSIPRWLGDLGGLILESGRALIRGFIAGMHDLWDETSGFFESLVYSIPRWLGAIPGLIVHLGGALIRGFIGGMTSLWSEVSGFFSSLIFSIPRWMASAGDLLWDVGVNIIRGLGRGIKAVGGELIDALLDALGPLAGVARKLFHVDSPSKVFMDIGQNLMAGLAAGISDTRTVEAALANLEGLSPSLNLGLAGVGAGGWGTGTGPHVSVSLDLRGATVTADSVDMLRDIVADGVSTAMGAVARKTTARGPVL